MDSEGNCVDPIEAYDAFVYGEYLFREIRTSANANLDLISFHANVYEDGFYLAEDGDIYDLGTKDDKEIKIGTDATDAGDGDKLISRIGEVWITDTVKYENLVRGKEYTLEGKLFNKTTGTFVQDAEGNVLTATTFFVAAAPSGTATVTFVFDGVLLEEAKEIVAFESLYEDGMLLVVHNDPNDVDQTLTIEEPEIGTTLTDKQTGEHKVTASEDIILVDTVAYTNLVKGKTYMVEGILMDKETGKPALDDSRKEIKASAEFVAKGKEGTVEIEFHFSGLKLAGRSVVAFETVSYEGREIAVHADINDDDQTVEIEEPEKPTPPPTPPGSPKTGDTSHFLLWMQIMLASSAIIAAIGIIYTVKKKAKRK